MTPGEQQVFLATKMLEESIRPKSLWWFSYAENGFLGVNIVRTEGFFNGVALTKRLGINPGGEVIGMPMDVTDLPDYWLDRLLTADEARDVNEYIISQQKTKETP